MKVHTAARGTPKHIINAKIVTKYVIHRTHLRMKVLLNSKHETELKIKTSFLYLLFGDIFRGFTGIITTACPAT